MVSHKLVTLVLLLFAFSVLSKSNAQSLRLGFYQYNCPAAEYVISKTTSQLISKTPSLAAALLRMHFHDCFVRGCDGSVLLDPTPRNAQTEKTAIPNLSLRGYQIVDAAKSAVENICPGVVSCSDILALVAREAVKTIGGPYWDVPTGRRDGKVSIALEALTNLPPPFANITQLKSMFASKGLNAKDLVVLSGGHTIGISHCSSFTNRLYNFTGKGDMDPKLDPYYAIALKKLCPPNDMSSIVEMDPGSVKTFDTKYFSTVSKRRGLFQSDAALLDDQETKAYVLVQSSYSGPTFSKDFANSMVKMGKIGVLTGSAGEIRKRCAFVN